MIEWNSELINDVVSVLRQSIAATKDRLVLNNEELNADELLEVTQVQMNAVTSLENCLLIYNNLLPEHDETKRYKKKVEFVEAYKTNRTEEVESSGGKRVAHPGDYIVTDSDGLKFVLTPEYFFSKFEEVETKPYEIVGANK